MANIEGAIKHIEGSLKSEDNGICYILQSRLWHIRHLLKKQQEEVKNLKTENERLRQEKADAVSEIKREQELNIPIEPTGDYLTSEVINFKYQLGYQEGLQKALDIINKPPKEGVN